MKAKTCCCGHARQDHSSDMGPCSQQDCQCKKWRESAKAPPGVYNLRAARNLLRARTGKSLLTDDPEKKDRNKNPSGRGN